MTIRTIHAPGLEIIKSSETLRLNAYPATKEELAKGIWTIGYGHTRGVKEGDTCSIQQADEWLREDCYDAERTVNWSVTHPLTQNQFDALVSLVFNIGDPQFRGSTLLRRLNAGLMLEAADEFPKWNKQAGKVLGGLVTRRARERELFLKPSE